MTLQTNTKINKQFFQHFIGKKLFFEEIGRLSHMTAELAKHHFILLKSRQNEGTLVEESQVSSEMRRIAHQSKNTLLVSSLLVSYFCSPTTFQFTDDKLPSMTAELAKYHFILLRLLQDEKTLVEKSLVSSEMRKIDQHSKSRLKSQQNEGVLVEKSLVSSEMRKMAQHSKNIVSVSSSVVSYFRSPKTFQITGDTINPLLEAANCWNLSRLNERCVAQISTWQKKGSLDNESLNQLLGWALRHQAFKLTINILSKINRNNLIKNKIIDNPVEKAKKTYSVALEYGYFEQHMDDGLVSYVLERCPTNYHISFFSQIGRLVTCLKTKKHLKFEEVEAVANMVKDNRTITRVDLNSDRINKKKAGLLAKAFEGNKTITCLNLSDNDIGGLEARIFAKVFRSNTILTRLNLSGNFIQDSGAEMVVKIIMDPTSLTDLDLSYNDIGDPGAKILAKALKKNTTLRDLNLSDNDITNEAAPALADALSINVTLSHLNLSKNFFRGQAIETLKKAQKLNPKLTNLNLSDNEKKTGYVTFSGEGGGGFCCPP